MIPWEDLRRFYVRFNVLPQVLRVHQGRKHQNRPLLCSFVFCVLSLEYVLMWIRRMSNEEGAAVRRSVDLLKRLDHSHVLGIHSSWVRICPVGPTRTAIVRLLLIFSEIHLVLELSTLF